jgi:hypothetical protein
VGLYSADMGHIGVSSRGTQFADLGMVYNCNSHPNGCTVRDPDIAKFGSTWWLLHTCGAAGNGQFCITHSTTLENWADYQIVTLNSTTAQTYAPNWVHNPDGTPYLDTGGCPHAAVVYQPNGTTYHIAETHPTNCSNFTQAWSQAAVLALPTGEMVPNQLDPYIICMAPGGGNCTGTGDTFYLWYLELTLSTTQYINYASASSLTGTYTLVSPGGNWAGWPTPNQEGPALIKLSDRWRMYFDNVGHPPGDLTDGQIYYSDSFDNWGTWTTATPINTQVQAKHGTVIPYP